MYNGKHTYMRGACVRAHRRKQPRKKSAGGGNGGSVIVFVWINRKGAEFVSAFFFFFVCYVLGFWNGGPCMIVICAYDHAALPPPKKITQHRLPSREAVHNE